MAGKRTGATAHVTALVGILTALSLLFLYLSAVSPGAKLGLTAVAGLFPAGAVISAEPGVYLPGRFGVRIEDVLILKEGGCEDITRSPKDLIVL